MIFKNIYLELDGTPEKLCLIVFQKGAAYLVNFLSTFALMMSQLFKSATSPRGPRLPKKMYFVLTYYSFLKETQLQNLWGQNIFAYRISMNSFRVKVC